MKPSWCDLLRIPKFSTSQLGGHGPTVQPSMAGLVHFCRLRLLWPPEHDRSAGSTGIILHCSMKVTILGVHHGITRWALNILNIYRWEGDPPLPWLREMLPGSSPLHQFLSMLQVYLEKTWSTEAQKTSKRSHYWSWQIPSKWTDCGCVWLCPMLVAEEVSWKWHVLVSLPPSIRLMALEFALDCFCFFLQLLQLSHLMSKTNDMTAGPLPASDLNHTSTIPQPYLNHTSTIPHLRWKGTRTHGWDHGNVYYKYT